MRNSGILRPGELRPVYSGAVALSGTIQITEPATWRLVDVDGVEVLAEAEVTGQSVGALSEVQVWAQVDAADLDPGAYYVVFTIMAMGSDNLPRVFKPNVLVYVAGEMG